MTVRLSALVCLGLVCPIALEGMARAAGESSLAAGIAGVLADSGSSGREVRSRAVEAIPLDRMGRAERQVAEQALQQTTLYRHLPAASITCDAGLLDFILTKPEALVDVWRVLGISRLALDPTAPGRWRLSDGYGTVGTVQLLHRERSDRGGLCVFHGRGAYDGPLAPKQLTGSCLVVVRYVAEPALPGVRPRQTVQVDAFLDVAGVGLELVTRRPTDPHPASGSFNARRAGQRPPHGHATGDRSPHRRRAGRTRGPLDGHRPTRRLAAAVSSYCVVSGREVAAGTEAIRTRASEATR